MEIRQLTDILVVFWRNPAPIILDLNQVQPIVLESDL